MNVIGFSETEHINSVEVVDGTNENIQLLESHMNSFRNAITMDNTTASIGVEEKFVYLPLSDDQKQYANEVSELEGQLRELFIVVEQMIKTGDEGTARELIEANYEVVTEQLEMGVKGVEQAAMLLVLAQLNMSLCEFTFTEYLLEQIKEIMTNVGNQEPLVDRILEHTGSMYIALEKPEEALPLCTRSLEIQEGILGKNSPLLVTLLLCLADTHNLLCEENTSIELYHRAISILEARKGVESEDLVFPLTQLSQVLIEEYRIQEAEDSLRRALAIMEKQHGENDAAAGSITCVLARALCAKGEVKDAVALYKKGLYIMENSGKFSLDDSVLETIRIDLAELLHVLGREEESQQLWEQNLLRKEEALGNDHPSLAMHIQNLATSYAHSGKFEKSELLLRRCVRILSARLVHDAPETSVPMLSLATILYHQGRNKEAEDLALDALRIREAFFDKDGPIVGEACDCLALIQHALGKDDRAESLMWRVLQIQEKEFGYDSPEVMSTLELLIVLVDNLGKKNQRVLLQRRLAKLKTRYRK
ncbi:uncharacterized protein LOC131060356 isoform X2 [Cryptomeria japonica]|uniref:uncharacterized protein LOC131060356 isoform X2 n=1 Tax=Cryptomeria japonica TaxID=3369 RepID=UPI0027DA794D|nr:uncharacterized protein LOC131060356 isoform X2 [Cryptomeria japonica]